MSIVQTKHTSEVKVDVDIKKVDYTIEQGYVDNELQDEINEHAPEPKKIIEEIEKWDAGVRPVMHILGRSAGGTRVHLRVHGTNPYFYVPADEYEQDIDDDDKVIKTEKGHRNQHGEHMVKIYTRLPGDVPKLRDRYNHYEADILFPNRFLIDSGIEGSIKIPRSWATPEPTDILVEDLEDGNYDESSRICFADIEVDDEEGFPDQEVASREIISITAYDSYLEDYQIFLYHPEAPDVGHEKAKVRTFLDEKRMLKEFSRYIKSREFDVITGWNFDDFDSRYIVNRFEYLKKMEDKDNVSKNDISPLGSAYDDGWFGAKVKGLAVFDLLKAYKNLQFTDLDSYSLEDVAQEELGTGKIQRTRSLHHVWKNKPQTLVDYNVKDVELTVKLDEEQDIIKFYEEIANYVGGRLAEVIDPSKAVDIKLLRAVHDEYVVPSSKNVQGGGFEGAEVFDPITGVRENVIVLDLASLYPMSMKTLNAGPTTKDSGGDVRAPNGVTFTTDKEAVVVEIIDEMLEERERYKRLRDKHPTDSKQYEIYDRKQTAIKVVMNTLYGVLGWSRFRLYDKDVGSAVTATGRAVIKFTEEIVNEMGYEVIYGDTDSVMLELGTDYDKEEIIEIGHELEERINEAYDEFAKQELNADEHFFEIEFEKLYRRYFQAGKKKRYAGHIIWKEGKEVDDVDIVGFEFKRSDYSKIAKEIQQEVLDTIVRGGGLEEISEYVRGKIEELKSGDINQDEFGIPSSIGKAFDDYENKTPAVRGSEYANEWLDGEIRTGDKPKKAYVERLKEDAELPDEAPPLPSTNEGDKFICWMNYNTVEGLFEWNWEKYIDNQIKAPLKRILLGTEWTWAEVITGNRQPKLGEFEFKDRADDSETQPIAFKEEEDELPNEFDVGPEDPWEEQERAARQQLAETQNMLDGFSGDTEDEDGEVIKAEFTKIEDGQPELDQFLN